MSALAFRAALPAITPSLLSKVNQFEAFAMTAPQVELRIEHIIHGGLYARTLWLPSGVTITGSLLKRATTLIVSGRAWMLINDGWAELEGYNVIPASTGRKQIFVSAGAVMTMIYATSAKTVEEAEAELTDEADLLLSHRQSNGTTTITGE